MIKKAPQSKALEKSRGQALICQTEGGQTRREVRLEDEIVWAAQKALAALYQTSKQNISLHIQNVYHEGELEEYSVVKDFLTTAADGKNCRVKFYNLDMILSVGCRVKSRAAVSFRPRAAARLKEHVIKSFLYLLKPGFFRQ